MIYGSVCSGIEGATVAWKPLGWQCEFVAEIDPFCSALLKHYYPETPNYGDFTKIGRAGGPTPARAIQLLVGGTPCQSFSLAGLRKGLADPRGNLALEYLALAERLRPAWLVWENVPGVLSSSGGRDFGAFLGALGQLGYGFAYRVLDAQYAGVPQRRRRVFVVGHLGDWRRAAAVLFERHSLQGHLAPSREARKGTAGFTPSSFGDYREECGSIRANGGDLGGGSETLCERERERELPARCLNAHGCRLDYETETFVTSTLVSNGDAHSGYLDEHGLVASPLRSASNSPRAHGKQNGTDRETLIPVAVQEAQTGCREYATSGCLRSNGPGHDPVGTRVRTGMSVRRLTPLECERLMGFPDRYTLIPYRGKPAADWPRYKALGNSWAVPVVRWIGERIQAVQNLVENES